MSNVTTTSATTTTVQLKSILNADDSKSWTLTYSDPYWFTFPPVAKEAHYFVGCSLAVIGIVGGFGNALVIWVFANNKRLRTPANNLIVNLAVSDFLNAFLFPMSCYSSFAQQWSFGKIGCDLYAAGTGLFGLMSIVTLSAISLERYLIICVKPMTARWNLTHKRSIKTMGMSWLYCLALMLPPFVGWGRYSAEGFLISCSFDYLDRSISNRTFIVYLFTFGFVMPVTCIIFCYSVMLRVIHVHEKEMVSSVDVLRRQSNSKKPRARVDTKLAKIVLVIICLFLVSWTPYSLVTLIAQFGDRKYVTPWTSTFPALFAKASIIYNPFVYAISHPQFRKGIKKCFLCSTIAAMIGRPNKRRSFSRTNTMINSLTKRPTTPSV